MYGKYYRSIRYSEHVQHNATNYKMATMTGEAELVSKPGTKAQVWEFFGLKKANDGSAIDDGNVYCRACRKKVVAKQGNTSNLQSHLRTNHPRIHAQLKGSCRRGEQQTPARPSSSIQPTLAESFDKSKEYDKNGKRWTELTDAVTYFIAKDCQAMYAVEKPGFKKMINTFDKRYTLPSRKYFSRTALPKLYSSLKEKVRKELEGVTFFSSTTDLWSSIGMKPYISFTVHFIDSEWVLQSRCLQTQFIPDDHTGENISESLKGTLEYWDLNVSQQVCMTTDSGSNVVKAANDLGWIRLSCFGHNLHLAVTKAISKDSRCTRTIGVSRKIVSAFSMSWKRKRDLSKAQIDLGLKQHSLIAVSLIFCLIISFSY